MMDFKYQFGETYYFNKQIRESDYDDCLYCDKGKIKHHADGKKVDCPVCNGKGLIEKRNGSYKEVTSKCFLDEIRIFGKNRICKEEILYFFVDENKHFVQTTDGTYVIETIIYNTIDDCIKGQRKIKLRY